MLLNLTNHPSNLWPGEQISLAITEYKTVEDLIFPQIDPEMDEIQLDELIQVYLEKVLRLQPKAVHIMGEMTFTFRLVSKLKKEGIICIASTTERKVEDDGEGNKVSKFKFVRFRKY